jgi:hypothetical protein
MIVQAVSATASVVAVWLASGWRPSRPKLDNEGRPLLRFGTTSPRPISFHTSH